MDIHVGAELARARRARGLSRGEISNRTNIGMNDLAAIEDNHLERLPSLSLRGWIAAYAAAVELDTDDVTDRYLAQIGAEQRVDVLADSQWTIDAFPTEASLRDPVVASSVPLSPTEAAPTVVSAPMRGPESIESTAWIDGLNAIAETDFDPSILADHSRIFGPDLPAPPTAHPWYRSPERHRYGGMALVALTAAASGFLLAEYSHRWGLAVPVSQVASTQRNGPQASNPARNAAAARRGESTGHVVALAPVASGDTTGAARVSETSGVPPTEGASVPPREPETSTVSDGSERPTTSRDAQRVTGSTPTARRPAPAQRRTNPSAENLSGWWSVTNRVESTAYRPYENLNLGYRVKLTQNGDQISGTGLKWMENGRQLPRSQRTPIAVNGTVEERQLVLQFTEHGTRRTSAGKFMYVMSDTGVLEGSFTSDVALSKGSSRARRMESDE
jgi:transcriptional regulator with XRE-family HTH domain